MDLHTKTSIFLLSSLFLLVVINNTKGEIACKEGWELDGNRCLQTFKDAYKLWAESRSFCQKKGGDLVTIKSEQQLSFFKDWQSRTNASGWIGLRRRNGIFVWLDETEEAQITDWKEGEPNRLFPDEDCVEAAFEWKDSTCENSVNFPICEIRADIITCPSDYALLKEKKICMKAVPDLKSWEEARVFCQIDGGDLVSIPDQETGDFVMKIQKGLRNDTWIGLHDRQMEERFQWLNDAKTKITYTDWSNDGDNDSALNNCGYIAAKDEKWTFTGCSSKKASICQVPVYINGQRDGVTETESPTPGNGECGAGWKRDADTGVCYRLNSQKLTWFDARDSCNVYGGELVSVSSLKKTDYLKDKLTMEDNTVNDVWIGGSDTASDGSWTWSDNSPFAFFNWNSGEPNGTTGDQCISFNAHTGLWSANSCVGRRPSFCKKLAKPPLGAEPSVALNDVKSFRCDHNWAQMETSCYLSIKNNVEVDWNVASQICLDSNANLVSIADQKENMFVHQLVSQTQIGDGSLLSVWIGFSDPVINSPLEFEWNDGVTNVTFTNWNVQQPDETGEETVCVTMDLTGKWADDRCSVKRKWFVCEKNANRLSESDIQRLEGCDQGGFGYQDKCYIVNDKNATFDQARKDCQMLDEGDLVVISNGFIQANVFAGLKNENGSYWIGLTSQKSMQSSESQNETYVYSWVNGAKLTFKNWDQTYSGVETNTCVGMRGGDIIGLWKDYPCDEKMRYVCEYVRSDFTTPKPVPIPPTILPCPTGWLEIENICYKMFMGKSSRKSWMYAKRSCQSQAPMGKLVYIHNQKIANQLAENARAENGGKDTNVWIGLNDRDTEGLYLWDDGQPFEYENWNGNEPDDNHLREDCVYMDTKDTTWFDYNCYHAYNYICQIPRGVDLYPPSNATSVNKSAAKDCGGKPWSYNRGNCYRVNELNRKFNWYDARKDCQSQGADLATLRDSEENGYITTLVSLSDHKTQQFWLGLNDFDGNVYKWVDGRPLRFYEWKTDEPLEEEGGQRCVRVDVDGSWDNYNCLQTQPYVCKKRPGRSVQVKSASQPPPAGGCPAGFYGVPGTTQCYRLEGSNSLDRKTFKEAKTACRSIYSGSRFASIHSDLDQDVVMLLLAEVNAPIWIGLSYSGDTKGYTWVDNTRLSYTNWATEFPQETSSKANNECVELNATPIDAGKWMNGDCSQRLPYVCEYIKDPKFPQTVPKRDGCKSGYQRFRSSCYKYVDTPSHWGVAEMTCFGEGGHLISVQDNFEKAFLDVLISNDEASEVWIALTDTAIESYSFELSRNGWPVIYTPKNEKEPNSANICVAHSKSTHQWNSHQCIDNLPYVCEITDDGNHYPLRTLPGRCKNNRWIRFGYHCYYVETTETLTWREAATTCNRLGGVLASIHSHSDALIVSKLTGQRSQDAWIGLKLNDDGNFTWDDGTDRDFVHWAPGYPRVSKDKREETCGVVQMADGMWIERSCYDKLAYVCKSEQDTDKTPIGTPNNTPNGSPDNTQNGTSNTVDVGVNTGSTAENGHDGSVHIEQSAGYRSRSNGLSRGAVAAIVGSCLAVLCAAIIVLIVIKKKRKGPKPTPIGKATAGYDNSIYMTASDMVYVGVPRSRRV